VYVGHAGIALILKSRAPEVPIVPLALACYGPDWIDAALMIPGPREGMAPYSHSLPALVIGAAVAGGLYAFIARKPGAMVLVLGWLLHWPMDFLTGIKPVVGLRSLVGLDLYHLPLADVALESVVIVVACMIYARTFAKQRRQRGLVVALAITLLVIQVTFDVVLSRIDPQPWHPSLAFLE
jgi:hypothetical protein